MVTVLFQWSPFIFSMKSGFIGSPDRPEAKLRSEKVRTSQTFRNNNVPLVVPPILLLLSQKRKLAFHCFHILYHVAPDENLLSLMLSCKEKCSRL